MSILAGFMVPHPPLAVHEVGRGEENEIKSTLDAFDEVSKQIASLKPELIIVTSPHSIMYTDYFHISPGEGACGDFSRFRAPGVRFEEKYDIGFVSALEARCKREAFPAGCEGERDSMLDHGTMVPLYFIEKYWSDFRLVRTGLSGLPLSLHRQFGRLIRQTVDELGRRAVFVASGDLSHCQKKDGPYGFAPEGPEYDEKIMEVMGRGDFDSLYTFPEDLLEGSMECGHRSFCIMGGALEGLSVDTKCLSHEATFGVGYGICSYTVR